MTAWKYLLNCPPVNPICLIYYANFHYISAAHDCRSRGLPAEPFVYAQPHYQQRSVLEQLSSAAAGARYLKNKCSRSDLPSDDAIDRAAWNVGKKRGWGNIDYATLSQRSTQMYQQLQQDSTPETTKCSQFNR